LVSFVQSHSLRDLIAVLAPHAGDGLRQTPNAGLKPPTPRCCHDERIDEREHALAPHAPLASLGTVPAHRGPHDDESEAPLP
jgi:hypothetical protein